MKEFTKTKNGMHSIYKKTKHPGSSFLLLVTIRFPIFKTACKCNSFSGIGF